ncbi:DUF2523 family protein [Pseudomonas aeruginosa]|nr:DUF2523 family protein [Pseudomonas aeruginosa]
MDRFLSLLRKRHGHSLSLRHSRLDAIRWDFLYSGVYDFVTDAFVLLTKMAIKGWFEMQLFVAEIGYKAFKEVVGGIGIGSTITSYYSSLDGDLRSLLAFFGLPDAVNMIFAAIGTRFSMSFIPFIGK